MIQPSEIKSQSFKKGLFGYKAADVDSFKDSVYRAYDELFKENAELADNLEKVNESLKESRLKIFDLENQLQEAENGTSLSGDDNAAAKKKADEIIKNAEATAATIIAKAKEQAESIEKAPKEKQQTFNIKDDKEKTTVEPKEEESASSKFFKKASEETASKATNEDDDEIFVGEIEDARKPDRMMIGDGEEEEDMDFEFL